MKKYILHILIFACCSSFFLNGQEGGVVALNLPVRNSLKFNRQLVNPTFSFVREQNKYISFTNKREWGQFNNAPLTYIAGYSGRFKENIGAGLSLFQQNYGVLTTFGGVANFAYNVVLSRDSNLTFGLNLGAYSSGLNQGKVVSNFSDPALDNVPSNMLVTVNPGINYGTGFIDIGVSLNNIVAYNISESNMLEDNPEQAIQVHGMYTGYFNSRGFFDESKFTGFIRSEFKPDQTIISGLMMVSVPKGLWGQVGYNTLHGFSAGVGLNISSQIAIEYNYEKALGDINVLGHSHDITIAYRFKDNNRYDYSGDDREEALLIKENKRSKVAKRNPRTKPDPRKTSKAKENGTELAAAALLVQQNKEKEAARLKAEQEAQALAEAERLKAEEAAQRQSEDATRLKAEQEAQALAEAERLEAEEAAQRQAEEAARLKAEQEAQALAEAERLKAEEAAQRQSEEAARLKAEQEAQALAEAERLEAEEAAQRQSEEAARLKAEQEAQALAGAEEEVVQAPIVPTDEATKEMNEITQEALQSDKEQDELLSQLADKVSAKQKDLDDLIEENDLSEQGIIKPPKPFKSISEENRELEALTSKIDKVIKSQNSNIRRLDNIYKQRLKTVSNSDDPTNKFYKQKIKDLKSKQLKAIQLRQSSVLRIEQLKEDIKIERKRRIQRALYDNEDDRYNKDRASLERIKQTTSVSVVPLKASDFDSGETLDNIQIIKGLKHVEEGYYLVVAIHSDVKKRDDFLKKAVAAGESNIDFFYDVNTSKYYIYYDKHSNISSAQNTMATKGSKAYNNNMSIVRIED
ncbi:PorP/SprF family type IX secretion system membrane protein [Cognatitamlana onchidii]|uniref:PorP/SprF family type IX secretion system membrane protein n=1 Tax=Cognatitamlana onchidii TaxID=2562860 RepID=UPI0010A6608D|nr:PorP/SprF family type IX secretion system membrane protein [Algibacter onchidii]